MDSIPSFLNVYGFYIEIFAGMCCGKFSDLHGYITLQMSNPEQEGVENSMVILLNLLN